MISHFITGHSRRRLGLSAWHTEAQSDVTLQLGYTPFGQFPAAASRQTRLQ